MHLNQGWIARVHFRPGDDFPSAPWPVTQCRETSANRTDDGANEGAIGVASDALALGRVIPYVDRAVRGASDLVGRFLLSGIHLSFSR